MRLLLVGTVVLLFSLAAQAEEATQDSLQTIKKNVEEEKAVLVDVREKKEWDAGHIEGSLFLPLSELNKEDDDAKLTKRLPKDKILYTFCVKGVRSATAAEILEKKGFEVRFLKPGYQELIDAGFKKSKE